MPAVVVMATVEEPCAVLRMAASRNGKKMPSASRVTACSLMKFTISVEAMTLPRTPPAAVMKRIGPTVLSVSWTRSWNLSRLAVTASWMTPKTTPIARAIMGVPKKVHRSAPKPLHLAIEEMEPRAMSTMGTTMGASVMKPPGSWPYWALISS